MCSCLPGPVGDFHLVPAHDHGFDAGRRRMSGGRQVDVHDDEGGEQPGDNRVKWGQEGQAADKGGRFRPNLPAPHQKAGEHLQGQEYVENGEISYLL